LNLNSDAATRTRARGRAVRDRASRASAAPNAESANGRSLISHASGLLHYRVARLDAPRPLRYVDWPVSQARLLEIIEGITSRVLNTSPRVGQTSPNVTDVSRVGIPTTCYLCRHSSWPARAASERYAPILSSSLSFSWLSERCAPIGLKARTRGPVLGHVTSDFALARIREATNKGVEERVLALLLEKAP